MLSPLTPVSRSLNPEAFRRLIQTHGQRVRYWRATPCPCRNPETGRYERICSHGCRYGYFYYEAELDAASAGGCGNLNGVRAYIFKAKKAVQDAESGLYINVGDTMITTLPDEIFFDVGDMFLSLDAQVVAREVRERGGADTDELTQLFPFAVDEIRIAGTVYDAADYQLVVDDATGAGVIKWLSNAPATGKNYTVMYRRRPLYWSLGQVYSLPRPSDYGGKPLPLTGALSLKHPSAAG